MQNYIRAMREKRGMTLEFVAGQLACTKAQISKLERGHIRLHDEWLDKLSQVFRCSVHDLIDDDVPISTIEGEEALSRLPFACARMLGFVESEKAGYIDYLEPAKQYPMYFASPKLHKSINASRAHYFSLTVKGSAFPAYPENSQLIFMSLTDENAFILKEASVILCALKNDRREYGGDFLRVIEYDQCAVPYAVYKLRQTRNITTTIASTVLLGKLSSSEKMTLLATAEKGFKNKHPITLAHDQLDINAVLVKVVVDSV